MQQQNQQVDNQMTPEETKAALGNATFLIEQLLKAKHGTQEQQPVEQPPQQPQPDELASLKDEIGKLREEIQSNSKNSELEQIKNELKQLLNEQEG